MANKSKTTRILIAGFGGQGVLFVGKLLAYVGMAEDRQVSWLPSYGPEMRGGTANCSVVVSDEPVASPVVTSPSALIVRAVSGIRMPSNAWRTCSTGVRNWRSTP